MATAMAALQGAERILTALNPRRILEYAALASDAIKTATWLYVPTKMACGIGGCAGCVVHNPAYPTSLKVCCEGPFLHGKAWILRQISITLKR